MMLLLALSVNIERRKGRARTEKLGQGFEEEHALNRSTEPTGRHVNARISIPVLFLCLLFLKDPPHQLQRIS